MVLVGPWRKVESDPDLRNFELFSVGLNAGDLIIVVSDGVHDNFDPQMLGVLISLSLSS